MYLKKANEQEIKRELENIVKLHSMETCGLPQKSKEAIKASGWLGLFLYEASEIKKALSGRKTQYISQKRIGAIVDNAIAMLKDVEIEMYFISDEIEREHAMLWVGWFAVCAINILYAVSYTGPEIDNALEKAKARAFASNEQPVAQATSEQKTYGGKKYTVSVMGSRRGYYTGEWEKLADNIKASSGRKALNVAAPIVSEYEKKGKPGLTKPCPGITIYEYEHCKYAVEIQVDEQPETEQPATNHHCPQCDALTTELDELCSSCATLFSASNEQPEPHAIMAYPRTEYGEIKICAIYGKPCTDCRDCIQEIASYRTGAVNPPGKLSGLKDGTETTDNKRVEGNQGKPRRQETA